MLQRPRTSGVASQTHRESVIAGCDADGHDGTRGDGVAGAPRHSYNDFFVRALLELFQRTPPAAGSIAERYRFDRDSIFQLGGRTRHLSSQEAPARTARRSGNEDKPQELPP
jgi:hypothetical protein